jgi:anti-sigma factor ChrR (cupin superfamily)
MHLRSKLANDDSHQDHSHSGLKEDLLKHFG